MTVLDIGSRRTDRARLNQAPPRELPEPIDLEEGDQIIRDALVRWFRKAVRYRDGELYVDVENLIIKATPGTGKSRHALSEMLRMQRADDEVARVQRALSERGTAVLGGDPNAMPDDFPHVFGELTIWVVLPSMTLARDLLERFEAEGGRGCLIRGRTHEFVEGEGGEPCMRPDLVRELQKRGVTSISNYVCANQIEEDGETKVVYCPFFDQCEYQQQFPHIGAVIFTSSERLFEVQPKALRKPHLIVIDESIMQQMTGFGYAPKVKDVEKDAGPALDWFERIQAKLENGYVSNTLDRDEVNRLIKQIEADHEDEDLSRLRPDLDEDSILAMAQKRHRPYVLRLLRAALNWEPGQRILDAYVGPYPKAKGEACLFFQRRRDIRVKAPFVMLDATVDPMIADLVWGARTVEVPVMRRLHVIQTHGLTAGIRRMKSDDSERVRKRIAYLCEMMGDSGLLVANKGVEFDLPNGWQQAHFNALRGIDRYRDLDHIVVVGRPLPSSYDVRRMAFGLLWDKLDDEVVNQLADTGFQYARGELGFQTPEQNFGVDAWVGPHDLIERVRRQTCDAEVEQALDRIRSVRGDRTKMALLINEYPSDVPIEVLVGWKELTNAIEVRVAYHRLGGFLPVNGKWLASRFPDLWSSPMAAKKMVQRYEDPKIDAGYHKHQWDVLRMGATRYEVRSPKGQPHVVWSKHPRDVVEAWVRDHYLAAPTSEGHSRI